jgi:Copper binding proteins, plastocyanin/azurin family
MTRIALALAALLAGVALVGAACGGDDEAADTTTTETTETTETTTETTEPIDAEVGLGGSVGPGFEISLSTEDGTAVTSLPAGSYELEIEDLSTAHNFHLTGPGDVDVRSEVGDEGTENVQVELVPGEYTFVCDPHASTMRGTFEVS